RRRQGWWMCAFGVIGASTIATSLVSPAAVVDYVARSTVYSVVLGILVGLVVRRIDQMLTGGSGRRARRSEAAAQIRPAPPRTASLRWPVARLRPARGWDNRSRRRGVVAEEGWRSGRTEPP